MLSQLYPLAFIVSLSALTGWFYFKENEVRSRFFSKVFFGGLAVYSICWLMGQGALGYKMSVLGRELLILAAVPVVLSFFRKMKAGYFIMLLLALAALKYFYFDHLKATFPQKTEQVVDTPHSEPAQSSETVPDPSGELLVEIKDLHRITEIQDVLDEYGLLASPAFSMKDTEATDLDDYFLVNVPPRFEKHLEVVKQALDSTGLVEWSEENEQINIAPIETTPQRPLPRLNKKYGLNDPGLENLWGFEAMNVAGLYEILKNAKPKKEALIAILDTGVDANHEDLKDNFTSTQSKYDTDKAGHGTHCAGIAAAVSNNNIGIASFSQTNDFVQVTSIKVLSDGGFGTQQMIINGILEAADRGADVISLSLGGPSSGLRQRAYEKAVQYANNKGAILVVAAGNSNRNANEFTPANVPGVITVSAIDTLLGRASFSNFVQDIKMAVAAPGVKIYSTFPGSQYQTFNGTSMATPYVSGLVGLMKSLRPELTTKEAYKILNGTGTETRGKAETGKLIQPARAIQSLMGTNF
ncbi:MAG: S8 family serine peptidase [Saprospiraceae bacterium]